MAAAASAPAVPVEAVFSLVKLDGRTLWVGLLRDVTLRKMEKAQWDAVLAVNLDSVFNLCRHVVEGMTARGFGMIWGDAQQFAKFMDEGDKKMAAAMKAAGLAKA